MARFTLSVIGGQKPKHAEFATTCPVNISDSSAGLSWSTLPRTHMEKSANKSLQPTPVGVVSSADAGHVVDPAWLSFCR